MEMHMPICENRQAWVKEYFIVPPHDAFNNFYMLLTVPRIVLFFKKPISISLYLPKEYVCACVTIYASLTAAIRA